MLLLLLENEKQRFIKKGGAEDGGSRCRANVVTPYKKSTPVAGACMHSMPVEARRHYTLISPKAELKVHVFLNVGHQQGKVVTSGTSVKIHFPTWFRSLVINCAVAKLTGIFSDIFNLKDCVGFSDSGTSTSSKDS